MLIYHQLTREFNAGRVRAVLCSGQAVVLHRLAITSKDGNWIVRELARKMSLPEDELLFSRSARDLLGLADRHPDLVAKLRAERPVLDHVAAGEDALAAALDAERRALIKQDGARLSRYQAASERWEAAWPVVSREIAGKSLPTAHAIVCEMAADLLPESV